MRKFFVLIIAVFLLTGCAQKESDNMDFSLNVEGDEILIEKTLRHCLENAEERMRLLYFKEDFEADLQNEKTVEIKYDQTQTIQTAVGEIQADRIILFGSGRLRADSTAEYIPIVTVHGEEISVWNCRWDDEKIFTFSD
jgi:hypothetical protein